MPRIRKTKNASSKEPFWKIGLYIRLSREDGNEDESESVINQQKILSGFVEEYFAPGTYTITGSFIDDGLTGTDTMRPGFQLLEDSIRRKEINCMIVKSLARAFRNLGDQQKFLEEFIPIHGTRFINLSSPFVDTFANPRSASGLEIPIRGMFNEQFAAQTSEEIRKTFKMKRERGEFIGAFAPYGYAKSPENKNRFIIDEGAAGVVRNIFDWFVREGYSIQGIAKRLSAMGEPNPSSYKEKQGLRYQNPRSKANDGLWSASTVRRILANRTYAGDMVQGRHRIISYKVHKQIAAPEEEWFIVPGTHEAVVDQGTFASAQKLLTRDARTAPDAKELHLFSGFIRCADCGKALRRNTAKGITYYVCRTYKDKNSCSRHSIREDRLEKAVLAAILTQVQLIDSLAEEMERVGSFSKSGAESGRLAHSLKSADAKRKQQQEASDSLYLDWKSGEITQEEYHRLKRKVAAQMEQLADNIAHLKKEMQMLSEGVLANDPFIVNLLQYRNIEKLNRALLVELVDTIWVHEDGGITIDFQFADPWKGCCV